jgi:peroxiredoxin
MRGHGGLNAQCNGGGSSVDDDGSRRGSDSRSELKVGDQAPDFSLQASDGKTYKLSDFKGKQAVVLAWFPKAFARVARSSANRSRNMATDQEVT